LPWDLEWLHHNWFAKTEKVFREEAGVESGEDDNADGENNGKNG